MKLLDRYLAAVARHLPKAQAADIAAELKDNLLSEIEERESGLGRTLTDKELEALLIDFGHPLTVAARYRKPHYLIGPEVYPFWFATLRIVFGILLAIVLVGLIVAATTSGLPAVRAAQVLAPVWPTALGVFGAVTLVFAVMERAWNGRMKLKWSPRQLPPRRAPGRKPFEVIAEMVAGGVFLLWWTGLIHFSAPVPAAIQVHLAPIWAALYWQVLAYSSTEIGVNALELARPGWTRLNAGLSLLKNLWGCGLGYQALQAGHWLEVNAPAMPPYALASMRRAFDTGVQLSILATVLVLAGKATWDVWRLFRPQGAADGSSPGSNSGLSRAGAES